MALVFLTIAVSLFGVLRVAVRSRWDERWDERVQRALFFSTDHPLESRLTLGVFVSLTISGVFIVALVVVVLSGGAG